ncbi:ParA family partition ATPase (plasmid) [Tistrella bauzanensis]|uniref:ParA family partition ATPase n=2 Tax=Tistrella bauzanensis TaxID=657419 RepID=UPI003559350C
MIVSFLNQKGGVGKTTLALNVAAERARRGRRVLVVDADPQGSALDWAAARDTPPLVTVIGLPRPTIHREVGELARGYDDVIIDGPPRVTDLARSAIAAADLVVVPVQPSPYDVWAADEVVKLIGEAAAFKGNQKSVFVINRRIAKTAIGRDVAAALAAYPLPLASTVIGQRVVYAEAAARGLAVFEIEENGPAAQEIGLLATELFG